MLATTTTDTLGIVDSAFLKKLPSSIPACLDLIASPVASSWSSDNINLFIASSRTIHTYDSSSNVIRGVYDVEGSESIRALVSKEKDAIIFSMDNNINILHIRGSETHITQTFGSHKTPITSLSLSNDNSLLASASIGVVHVHNLASGSHTVLRGLGNGEPGSTSVTFHMHSRTRLLVSLARQILVYDTTRPSGPLKTIPLSDSSAGDIVALSCSTFSRTLVAVVTSAGFVVLIDLEKEKPQVRTMNIKATPTAIEFSPEGGAIYVGTDDGKLLVVDLRSLDKPAKVVVVSEIGDPIRTFSIQRKTKANTDGLAKTPKIDVTAAAKTPSEPLPPIRRTASTVTATKFISKTVASPAPQQRAGKTTSVPRRLASATTEGSPVTARNIIAQSKKILSPLKDPLGNTNDVEHNLNEVGRPQPRKAAITPMGVTRRESKNSLKPHPSPSPRASVRSGRSQSSSKSTLEPKELRRTRTLPNSKSRAPPGDETKEKAPLPTTEHLSVPNGTRPRPRRITPSASLPGADPACGSVSTLSSMHSPKPSSASASRPSSCTSGPSSSKTTCRTTSNKTGLIMKSSSTVTRSASASRGTPSPDLPDPSVPITPAFKQQKNKKSTGMSVLGLGTPEVERWINAGKGLDNKDRTKKEDENNLKGKSKIVYFGDEEEDAEEVEELMERARKLSLQISPRRPVPNASGSTVDSWAALTANSPVLSATSYPANASASGPTSSAHDLLKTIIQDVMFDFQRETKAEMMGLHLDLLRMGRSWKTELRSLMDEYVGDLREIREENNRLRKENERLKRGWQ